MARREKTPPTDDGSERIPAIVLGVILVLFGVGIFVVSRDAGLENDRRMQLVKDGRAPIVTVTISRKEIVIDENRDNEKEYRLFMVTDRGFSDSRSVSAEDYQRYSVGDKLEGFDTDRSLVIPTFDKGGFQEGRWFFLAIGVVPGTIILLRAFLKKPDRRERR